MNDASGPQTGGAVYTTDADGFITLYNEAAVSLWGREPEAGKDRWCGSHRLYRPDGTPLSLDASPLAVALKEGRPIQGVELVIERPDGTRRHVRAHPEPIRDSAGEVVGAINTFADMTPHTRMETLMAGQQRVLQLAVDGAALGDVLEVLTRTIEMHLADGVMASILTLDRDSLHLRHGAAPSLPESYNRTIDGVTIGPTVGSCGTAAFRNDTVIVEDIATDPLWADFRAMALDHNLRACWSMPIRSSQHQVLGTFALYYNQVRNPTPQDLQVVELLAHTAAVILERDRESRERLEAERSLRESEERFRHMADHAPVMVWVTDPDGQCIFVSKSWYEFTGQEAGTGLGTGWIAALHSDDREPVYKVFASANSRREPFRLEFRLIRHDGVACWALVAAAPHLAPDGQFLGFIGSVLDIAERKQAEEALRQSEERFRIATQTGKVGVWDWDIIANRILWTDSLYGIHGVSPDAFPATVEGFTALIHPDDRERVTRAVEHSLRDDVLYELEFRAVRPNGEVIWLFTNAVVLRDGGKPVRMLGATLDITRRKRAEAALRESEAHYRTLMEQAHDSIFVCDGDGRFLMANSAGSRLLGYSLEELLHVRVRDTYLQSEVDASERRLHEVTAGHSLRFERTMVRKDRSTFEADISLTRLPNGQVYAMVRDITDRKRAEDAIRTRTEHMRLLSEALAQLLNARDPETIVRELFPKVAAHLSIDTYVNFMVDETGQALRLHSCAGIPDEVVRSIGRLEFGQAISGTVAQLREPIIANDIQHSGYDHAALVRSFGIQSYVCNPLIAGGRLLGTLSFASRTRPSFDHDEIEFLRVISQYTAVALDRLHTTKALSEHSRSLEILHRVGSTLAAELDLNTVVQAVTDAGREVSGADFGAFFYNLKNERGESYTLYTLSGVPREAFEKFPMPRNTALFGATFRGEGVIRIDDVSADPRYGHNEPYRGMPKGHLPVRSYLAVPVASRSGEVLGGLFFGHAEPGVFTEEAEKILVGIAAQASIAIDNANLYKAVQKELAEHKRIEEALRESEEKFRTMADNIAQFAWMADEQGRIFWYNQRWFDYTGTTLEEMEGWGWEKVHHPDHVDRVVEKIRLCFETGEFWEDTFPLRGHDGNYRWFLSRAIPIRDANGKVLRWFGTNTDVTAQREAETALRQSEGLYRAIGESNDYGIWVCDAAGRNTYASESFLRLVGLTQEECSEFGWGRVLHPDDVERTISAWKECVQAGGIWDCEHRFRGVDGRYHPILARGVPVRDADGLILGWAGFNLDISNLKQAQEDLREKSVRLLVALGASHTGTFQWNLRTDEVTWDEPLDHLFGLSSGQTTRSLEQFLDMIHPADRDAIVRACEHCRNEGGDFEAEFRVVWPDGTVRWLYDRGKTISLGDDGLPEYMTGACVDITERKQAEEQLRELTVKLEQRVKDRTDELTRSQERLRALATEVTLTEQRERRRIASELHDYLAQLLVVSRMKLTQGRKQNRDDRQEVWLKELDQLLGQSLTYTRSLVAQLSPPVLHEFGLVKAFHWLAETMQHQGLSVDVQAQDLFLTLPEDKAVLLYQSVRELLFNVVKHADAGRASVSVQVMPEHELRITVTDQGQGFDLAATMTTGPLSTGYGLFSIRERMAVMGGTLTVTSAPGQGTRVMIAIPYTQLVETASLAPASGIQPDVRTGSPAGPSQGKTGVVRVLLVDDHAMVRQGLRSILDSYDDIAIVGEAGDGLEAVGLADSLTPDVVVMDLNMPRMDGIEATRRITQAVPAIVVIGLSVRNDREAEQAMRSAGASGYLTKESAADQLHQAICQATKRMTSAPSRSS